MYKQFIQLGILFMALVSFNACEPSLSMDADELGSPPGNVTFEITPGTESNTYILKSTTADAFLFAWDLGNGETAEGAEVTAFYQERGDYTVTLTAFNRGGSNSSTQILNVPEDAVLPAVDCTDELVQLLTNNCSSRTWVLNPEEGSLLVGPVDYSTVWWSIDANGIAERPCAYNDEWTFDGEGVMVYDTKGDIWGEDYLGFNFECADESAMGEAVAAWGSGTHDFAVSRGDGGSPDQLTLIGNGAFFGIPKAANGAEVSFPVNSVTYDVVSWEDLSDRYVIQLEVNYSGGIWHFQMAHFK